MYKLYDNSGNFLNVLLVSLFYLKIIQIYTVPLYDMIVLKLHMTYFRLKYQKITLIFKILYFHNGTSNCNKFWNIV